MRILVLFLFLAYPMLELALMIKVGGLIGIWALLGIIVATGVLGFVVLQEQGFNTLRRIGEVMAEGRPPLRHVFDGTLVGAAGMLLMAPGLITDALGLLLLLPPLRQLIFRWVSRNFPLEENGPSFETGADQPRPEPRDPGDRFREPKGPFGRQRRAPRDPIVIDGEYERIEERDPHKPRGDDAKS